MEQTRKFDEEKSENAVRVHKQVWGIAYLAGATYLLIALINAAAAPTTPLFGKILGTDLATGMRALFGTYPQYLFVLFMIYAGIIWLKNKELSGRQLVSFFLILSFVCTAFAIPHLPILRLSPSISGGNLLGCAIAKHAIYPLFGQAVFGSYFLLCAAMIVVSVYMFRIDVIDVSRKFWGLLKSFWRFLKGICRKVKDFALSYKSAFSQRKDLPQTCIIPAETPPNAQNANAPNFEETRRFDGENGDKDENVNYRDPQEEIDENGEKRGQYFAQTEDATPQMLAAAYIRPNPAVLPDFSIAGQSDNRRRNEEISVQLIEILEEFNIRDCKVVAVNPGPIVTLFEIEPGKGVKISAFEGLEKDIGIKIGGKSVRIDTIPNRTTIGIEVPNENRETVYFKEILKSAAFQNVSLKLPVIIGKSTTGEPLVEDIAKMPHILIAGQTGSGKSVGINSFIASLLFSKTPDELRLIMIDPKKVEMACYEGIPHLAIPVVTEVEYAVKALECAVKEMMSRYDLLKKVGSKNMDSFNEKYDNGELKQYVKSGVLYEDENKRMCYIVIIIDELADLMMTAGKDVEKHIQRIAQLARAVGIHLIVATQRPDTKVVTGNIKANLPSRIAFRVMSYIDSRTIIDHKGAELLLGNGDMLYLKNGAPKIVRYHGAFISEKDVEKLVDDIKKQGYVCENLPSFEIKEDLYEDNDVVYKDDGYYKNDLGDSGDFGDKTGGGGQKPSGRKFAKRDPMFEEAARMIVISRLGSTSSIQRHLNLGYARAGRVMDELAAAGVVGPQEVIGKPRKVLVSENELEDLLDKLSQESE